MIPNPTPTTLSVLLLGTSAFIFIMLLPAILELKRPSDAGPRIIIDDGIIAQPFRSQAIIPLTNIDDGKFGLDQAIVKRIIDVIAFLPNLEM